jgi:hypothetical protein
MIVNLGFVGRLKTMLTYLSFGEDDAINIFDALKSIVKTSPLLRDKVLQSDIVTRFSKRLPLESEDVGKSCVDMLKAMLCIKEMPAVEYSNFVYKPKNTVLKILIFHRKQFLGKLQYQNTVDQN